MASLPHNRAGPQLTGSWSGSVSLSWTDVPAIEMPAFHQKTMLLPTRVMHASLLFTASEESTVPLGDVWKDDPCSVVITEADARGSAGISAHLEHCAV